VRRCLPLRLAHARQPVSLRPDRPGLLRKTIAGVLAEAKRNWPNIANFATSVMTNHMHNALAATSGDPRDLADYLAFVKREITRRWRRQVGWEGSMWGGYDCTAIITDAAQVETLAYIVGQSCKENLVADPRLWPGFNCAESLVTGEPVAGIWFDGTAFGKARHAALAKRESAEVRPEDFVEARQFTFDKLPALAGLDDERYRAQMQEIVEECIAERARVFEAPPLGLMRHATSTR